MFTEKIKKKNWIAAKWYNTWYKKSYKKLRQNGMLNIGMFVFGLYLLIILEFLLKLMHCISNNCVEKQCQT